MAVLNSVAIGLDWASARWSISMHWCRLTIFFSSNICVTSNRCVTLNSFDSLWISRFFCLIFVCRSLADRACCEQYLTLECVWHMSKFRFNRSFGAVNAFWCRRINGFHMPAAVCGLLRIINWKSCLLWMCKICGFGQWIFRRWRMIFYANKWHFGVAFFESALCTFGILSQFD